MLITFKHYIIIFVPIILLSCSKKSENFCSPFSTNQDIAIRQSFVMDNLEGRLDLLIYTGVHSDEGRKRFLIVLDEDKRLEIFNSQKDVTYYFNIFSADINVRFIPDYTRQKCEVHINKIDNIYNIYDQKTYNQSLEKFFGGPNRKISK